MRRRVGLGVVCATLAWALGCGSFSSSSGGNSTGSGPGDGGANLDGASSADGSTVLEGGPDDLDLIEPRSDRTAFVQVVVGTSVCVGSAPASAGAYCQPSFEDAHSCALRNDRRVYCWGSNKSGRLGYLPADQSFAAGTGPIEEPKEVGVMRGKGVRSLAAGTDHTCAALKNGAVWCWGYNWNAQLGVSAGQESGKDQGMAQPPREASFLKDSTFIDAAEIAAGLGHTCVRDKGGAVACVGKANDQVQDAFAGNDSVSQISIARKTSCAVTKMGALLCSGDSNAGQLGGTGFQSRQTLIAQNVTAVSVGGAHVCAMVSGKAKCWGLDKAFGATGVFTPNAPYTLPPAGAAGGTAISRIAAGGGHTCFLQGGNAYCVGANDRGQAGEATGSVKTLPGAPILGDVRDIAATTTHTCAVTTKGEVYCWGSNTAGQFGRLGQDGSPTPVRVTFPD